MSSVQARGRAGRALLGSLVLVGGLAVGGGSAFADEEVAPPTPHTVDELKAKCNKEITNRLTALTDIAGRLANAKAVTTSHRSSLTTIIDTTKTNLSALKPLIDAGTTMAEVRKPCNSIIVDNRVYVLRLPQVRLTISLDTSDAATTNLVKRAADFGKRIAELKAKGKNTKAAEAALARLRANIAAERSISRNKADALIALIPASYNANHRVVDPFTRSAAVARDRTRFAAYWAARTNAEIIRIR